MKLLTAMGSNPKTAKGLPGTNYTGMILHLAHADTSGMGNVCPDHEPNKCSGPCLDNEGRGHTPSVKLSRLSRTALFFTQRATFYELLRAELRLLDLRAAAGQKLGLARLDATSDLGIGQQLCAEYPRLLFFDYTKSFQRVRRHLAALKDGREKNYHLTFSLGAGNMKKALQCLEWGVNVAAVFRAREDDDLPAEWNGYEVIDGDLDDWRFLDESPVWVGLRSKGGSYNSASTFLRALPGEKVA